MSLLDLQGAPLDETNRRELAVLQELAALLAQALISDWQGRLYPREES